MKSLLYIFFLGSACIVIPVLSGSPVRVDGIVSAGTLAGSVADSITAKGLFNAEIIFSAALWTFRTLTAENGEFVLTGLPPGIDYPVTVARNDYRTAVYRVSVAAGKTTWCSWSLSSTYLELLYPNGGESIFAGSEVPIRWTSVGIKEVRLEFSINGGRTWILLADEVVASIGFFLWDVQDIPSPEYRIRILDTGTSGLVDVSDRTFRNSSM